MPASVCQHESGRFVGPVKDKPRRYWHYRIAQFPAFQRQTAAFSADLTLKLSKSHMIALPYRDDQIIHAAMARALHADACRDHALVAWVVLWDLPPGLVRSERMPADPPE